MYLPVLDLFLHPSTCTCLSYETQRLIVLDVRIDLELLEIKLLKGEVVYSTIHVR